MRPSSDVLTVSRRICHDLRSPAGVILSIVDLLEEDGIGADHFLSIRSSAQELLGILDQTSVILRASYSSRPEFGEVDLGRVVGMVIDKIKSVSLGKKVRWEVAKEWPKVFGVEDWLIHIWQALISNACHSGAHCVELGWSQNATELCFWVRDNGVGVNPRRGPHVIPAFETLHALTHATRLALPLARRLTELMSGRIAYRRLDNGFSEFSFSLPRQQAGTDVHGTSGISDPKRIAALRRSHLIQEDESPALDAIVGLAKRVLKVSMVFFSVCDGEREYVRSTVGELAGNGDANSPWPDLSGLNQQVVDRSECLALEDLRTDLKRDGDQVNARWSGWAYLGVPVYSQDGYVLGTLVALRMGARAWLMEERELLAEFSRLLTREIYLKEEQETLQSAFRLQRQERTLNDHLMQHSTDCIKVLDDSGNLVDMNGPGCALMEIEDFSGVVGKDWLERYPGDGSKRMRQAMEQARQGITGRFQGICPTLKGQVRWWDVSVTAFTDGGGRSRFLVISRDLTKEKEAERVMEESEGRFRAMANQMSQFAWMADERGSVFWYNQRWLDYTGLKLEEMQGWGWQKVHHPAHVQRVVEKIRDCFERGESWEDTFPLRGLNGKYRWFLSRAVPIRDESGRVIRWFGTNTDVTEQLQTEEKLRKASQAKDQFIAILSHELRTPLNPALLIASEAATRTDLPEEIRKDFEAIRASVAMEARLIDDLLDLTRLKHNKLALLMGLVDVDRVLSECVAEMREATVAKEIELKLSLESGAEEIEADELRLKQAFSNVLRNAVKFTPRRGAICVSSRVVKGCFELEVKDSGIGMTQEELNKACEPFEQGRHVSGKASGSFGGLGLGLAITRTLMELHGGDVDLRSGGPDLGTTVRLILPIRRGSRVSALKTVKLKGGRRSEAATGSRWNILVVEDHEATRQTVMRLLQRRGYAVEVASSCASAVEKARVQKFDVAFSDLGLPDGPGHELVRSLHELQPDLACIAMSGYGMESDVQASLEAGFVMHMTKPVAVEDLMRALNRVEQARAAGKLPISGQEFRSE